MSRREIDSTNNNSNNNNSTDGDTVPGKWLMMPWLIISVIVTVLDQYTKRLADGQLNFHERVNVLPSFDLTLAYNYGAAFSFLADAGGWQRWFFAVIAVVITSVLIYSLYQLPKQSKWLAVAFTLIIGGAIGNVYDRIALGYVIDFILLYYDDHFFPAFNIADMAISLGAGMLIIDVLFLAKHRPE